MSSVISQAVAIGRRVAADYRIDAYQVVRATRTPDNEGGWTEAPAVVESGTAVLTAGATRPDERALADKVQAVTPYVLRNMPYTTTITASDTVTVNGRTFEVIGVLRAEAVNVAVTAVLEERQ